MLLLDPRNHPTAVWATRCLAIGLLTAFAYGASLIWLTSSKSEAIRLSVARTGLKDLPLALAVDPSFCKIRKHSSFMGSVECRGVPRHLFIRKIICDIELKSCEIDPIGKSECMDYDWDLDLFLNPSSPMPQRQRLYASQNTGDSDCSRGWTALSVRDRLAELGLEPLHEHVIGKR